MKVSSFDDVDTARSAGLFARLGQVSARRLYIDFDDSRRCEIEWCSSTPYPVWF